MEQVATVILQGILMPTPVSLLCIVVSLGALALFTVWMERKAAGL